MAVLLIEAPTGAANNTVLPAGFFSPDNNAVPIMISSVTRSALFVIVVSFVMRRSYGFIFPSYFWGDDESKETARNGWTPWIEFEESSEEGDSSVDLEDLVLTISLDGPPKTAKPTTVATTTTDSSTTTKPKPKPPPKG